VIGAGTGALVGNAVAGGFDQNGNRVCLAFYH
jgi:hypothetical protein